jgi:hypothetical protein
MKLSARGVAWVLPLLLTACIFHKTARQPVQTLPPPLPGLPKPEPTLVELSPQSTIIPSLPLESGVALLPGETINPPKRHRKPATPQSAGNAAPSTGNSPPAPSENSSVSAIGQLSSGDTSDLRRETMDSIAATERQLNGIDRVLSKQEQKTARQVREFLKQAREALNSGDVDGAHTLAAKARVLLGELTQ